MKTELRLTPHLEIPGATVLEIWHDGQFIGTVAGADGPGIRVISKFSMLPKWDNSPAVKVVEVSIVS